MRIIDSHQISIGLEISLEIGEGWFRNKTREARKVIVPPRITLLVKRHFQLISNRCAVYGYAENLRNVTVVIWEGGVMGSLLGRLKLSQQ